MSRLPQSKNQSSRMLNEDIDMAKNRYIETTFWIDKYIRTLDRDGKLLFVYLLTNSFTTIAGIYEIPLEQMALDTKIPQEKVDELLKKFETDKKVFYIEDYVYFPKFIEHQSTTSPKVGAGILNCLQDVPAKILAKLVEIDKELGYSTDKVSISSDSVSIALDIYKYKYKFKYEYKYNSPHLEETDSTSKEEEKKITPLDETSRFFSEPKFQEEIAQFLIDRGVPKPLATRELTKFISYWTEPTKSGKKVRWQLQPTFEIKRRLSTWFRNIQEFNKAGTSQRNIVKI